MDLENLNQNRTNAWQNNDKRITNIILNHWDIARGNNPMPSETDLDPNILESVLDNCFLIRTAELLTSGKHKYVYLGQNILNAYGNRVTDPKDFNDTDPLSHKSKFLQIIRTKQPIVEEGEFVNVEENIVKYRQCLVPLAKDGHHIDSIFGGMRFKIFT